MVLNQGYASTSVLWSQLHEKSIYTFKEVVGREEEKWEGEGGGGQYII